jgi:hypothetical protein
LALFVTSLNVEFRQKKLPRPKSGKARQYNRVTGRVASYPQFCGMERLLTGLRIT